MHLVSNMPPDRGRVFHLDDARPPRLPVAEAPQTTIPTHAVARILGVQARSERWQCRYLDQLIAAEGFPRPLPTLVGGALSHSVNYKRSRWIRAAVQAWLNGTLPSGINAQIEDAEAQAAADRMDAAADTLFDGGAA